MENYKVEFKNTMYVYAVERIVNPKRIKVAIPDVFLDKPSDKAISNKVIKGNTNIYLNETPPVLSSSIDSNNYLTIPVISFFLHWQDNNHDNINDEFNYINGFNYSGGYCPYSNRYCGYYEGLCRYRIDNGLPTQISESEYQELLNNPSEPGEDGEEVPPIQLDSWGYCKYCHEHDIYKTDSSYGIPQKRCVHDFGLYGYTYDYLPHYHHTPSQSGIGEVNVGDKLLAVFINNSPNNGVIIGRCLNG